MKCLRGMGVLACLLGTLAAQADDVDCLIISEVVAGAASGGCPKWIEITNTGVNNYKFMAGGIIIQEDGSSDTTVDINLTGVTIHPGESYVICSLETGFCTGAFQAIYGQEADLYVFSSPGSGFFGDGNDRYIITDTNDGSNLVDIYGEFGTDGTGTAWEYTQGYAYRLPAYNSGNDGVFDPSEWYFGGVDSLLIPEFEYPDYTHPGVHDYDETCDPDCAGELLGDTNCDGIVNAFDIDAFILAITDPAAWNQQYGSGGAGCHYLCVADCNGDDLVNAFDIDPFIAILTGG